MAAETADKTGSKQINNNNVIGKMKLRSLKYKSFYFNDCLEKFIAKGGNETIVEKVMMKTKTI